VYEAHDGTSTRRVHDSKTKKERRPSWVRRAKGKTLPRYACMHVCTSRRFNRDGNTSRAAHSTALRTERSSGARARIIGSCTCRCKARLDGRHTSVDGRAVAAVQFNQIKSTTSWARPDFSPLLEGRVPQQRGG
jgi:hypothetical protein